MSGDKVLTDIEAIRTLKARFAELLDQASRGAPEFDPKALCHLLTEDMTLLVGEGDGAGQVSGREAILAYARETVPGIVHWTWHGYISPIIEMAGDTATARWMFHAYSVGKTMPASALDLTVGRTVDEYRRVDGHWRISRSQVYFNGHWPMQSRA